ncbi:tRNA (uracil-5-)-methyltransferase homolog A [Fopius arisanus]|uniref:tRNA (uracil(54)-C(5))-methyltransferase n=1 Tax=Fopius arisanus TaxID=64838 RepID=A0A9R1T0I4_9HYME|nr:PREDICTED: tRNA (uracil-5-)-methyltransferase homolog A [Fopius arisanus]
MSEDPRVTVSNEDNDGTNGNPYEYLNREDFTSEKYKIEIQGLPKYYGMKELKNLLNNKLELDSSKVKPPKKGSGWLFVCFKSEEAVERAINTINGMTWKNCKLMARKAKPAPDPFIKRKIESQNDSSKKQKLEESETISPELQVKASTTPLWNIPYPKQLEIKFKEIRSVVEKLGQTIWKQNAPLSKWIQQQEIKNDGLICELLPILSADETEEYRNKCEFTVGKSRDGKEIVIGFRLSSYAAGSTAVGPIDDLCHIPKSMKTAVKLFQEFIRDSKLEPYDPVNHQGYWSQITARTTRLNHLMLIIVIHPQELSDGELTTLKESICRFFEEEGKEANVTSLYFQTITRRDPRGEGGGSLEHLSGSEYIEEKLLDMKFRVSPQAFFQVNSKGAEILYEAAIDLAKPNKNTSVLDVCCGTGTIGLAFSKHCGEVLGLEMVPGAIKDARENAKANNVDNCEFFVGKAEDILKTVLQRTTKPDVVAVVDPPRAGLQQQAVLALRKTNSLKRLIYISCDPKAAIKNLVDLARPTSKQYSGDPLVPVKAVPVDMFPHTNHCELIFLLERVSVVEEKK